MILECHTSAACHGATVRAYRELRARGFVDRDAFESAVRVLRSHHPELAPHDARNVVSMWLDGTQTAN